MRNLNDSEGKCRNKEDIVDDEGESVNVRIQSARRISVKTIYFSIITKLLVSVETILV